MPNLLRHRKKKHEKKHARDKGDVALADVTSDLIVFNVVFILRSARWSINSQE